MNDRFETATTRQPTAIEAHDDHLRVHFGAAAGHADFHWFWLRHNCDCCRHPVTGERTLCSSQVPLEIRPIAVELGSSEGGPVVAIRWNAPDHHRSTFAVEWLREAMALYERAEAVRPPHNDDSLLRWNACARLLMELPTPASDIEEPEPLQLE